MNPVVLEKVFEICQEAKVMVVAHLYETHCKIDEIKHVGDVHSAVIVEDVAEPLGATYEVHSGRCIW